MQKHNTTHIDQISEGKLLTCELLQEKKERKEKMRNREKDTNNTIKNNRRNAAKRTMLSASSGKKKKTGGREQSVFNTQDQYLAKGNKSLKIRAAVRCSS